MRGGSLKKFWGLGGTTPLLVLVLDLSIVSEANIEIETAKHCGMKLSTKFKKLHGNSIFKFYLFIFLT